MPIRFPYKFHLFVSYDCHSFLVTSKLKGISEVYLEPCRTFTMELFCKNSQRLKVVKYFRKKAPVYMFDECLRLSRTTDCIRSAKLTERYLNSPHVTNKMPTTNGYRRPGKTKHFFKSRNLLSIGVPHKFHLLVSYDCYSYHRIEFDVMCSV